MMIRPFHTAVSCCLAFACVIESNAELIIPPGEVAAGPLVIEGDVINYGILQGNGSENEDRIVFPAPWTVSGDGYFESTLIMGTFAPGNSPSIVNGKNQAFGGSIQFELGGTSPGSGQNNHDQINDRMNITLVGSPTIEVLPYNGFVPTIGDQFVLLTWTTGLSGQFGGMLIDPFFSTNGMSFTSTISNDLGAGSLTLTAIPEPSAIFCISIALSFLVANYSWSLTVDRLSVTP